MPRWGATVATLVLVVLLGAGLAACSDGGDGSDDASGDATDDSAATEAPSEAEAFCAAAEPQVEVAAGQVPGPTEADVGELEGLVELAPQELVDDLEAGVEVLRENDALFDEADQDPLDVEGYQEAADTAAQRAETALADVATYLAEECGLDLDPDAQGEGEGGETESGVDADAARAHLDEVAPDVAAKVASIEVTSSGVHGDTLVVELSADDVGAAVAACEALSGYVYDEVGAQFVEIYVEGPGLASASRLNETADCSGYP